MPNVVVKPLMGCPFHDRASIQADQDQADADRARAIRQGFEHLVIPHRMKNAPQAIASKSKFDLRVFSIFPPYMSCLNPDH